MSSEDASWSITYNSQEPNPLADNVQLDKFFNEMRLLC